MTATVTLELPENILIQALRQLPPARRQELLRRVENEDWRAVPAIGLKTKPDATRARRNTLDQALGMLTTEYATPSDVEIDQLLNERRERYE
jgi:hypothetical protein